MKAKKMIYMIVGIILIGICVASYRLAVFGVDPFTCMNLGISGFIGMSFGNWQLIMNIAILIVVYFTVRHCIGLGTVVNMVGVGYIADFICWIVNDQLGITMTLPLRIVLLAIGMLFASLGAAMYMTADLGIAPYDSVAFIIQKLSRNKVSFRIGRILSDVTVMIVGIVFCLLAGNKIWTVVGIGTVINAVCNGPLIQLFRTRFEKTLNN